MVAVEYKDIEKQKKYHSSFHRPRTSLPDCLSVKNIHHRFISTSAHPTIIPIPIPVPIPIPIPPPKSQEQGLSRSRFSMRFRSPVGSLKDPIIYPESESVNNRKMCNETRDVNFSNGIFTNLLRHREPQPCRLWNLVRPLFQLRLCLPQMCHSTNQHVVGGCLGRCLA